MEEAKKRSGNTLRDLQHFSYHAESESSNFLAISYYGVASWEETKFDYNLLF